MERPTAHSRRRQVLKLIAEHGPLSKRGLMACLYPTISQRRLYEVLYRLMKHNFVVRRTYSGLGKSAFFYAINNDPKNLKEVSRLINKSIEKLEHPYFRRVELLHSENCAIWKEVFKHLFPGATVVREHEYYGNQDVAQLLLSLADERETNPDIILTLDSKTSSQKISIAVEIERNPKSKARLIRKLVKYATQTYLDGVIYICEDNHISKRLRDVYNSEVLHNALRIRHYGNNFLVFTDGQFNRTNFEPMMFNSARENILLKVWISKLIHTENVQRRDSKFASPAQ